MLDSSLDIDKEGEKLYKTFFDPIVEICKWIRDWWLLWLDNCVMHDNTVGIKENVIFLETHT